MVEGSSYLTRVEATAQWEAVATSGEKERERVAG
jgi:hypothetical protein